PSSRKRASLSRSMTCASPFTTYSIPLFFELFEPGLERDQLSGLVGLLCVVIFSDPHDNVHHIRYAAGTFRASVQFRVNLGRDNQLPGISFQQIENNVLDLFRRDHVALADKHFQGPAGGL